MTNNIDEVIKGLTMLAGKLNSAKIKWSLGGSLLLYFKGFISEVNDIDIVVHEDDYLSLLEVLDQYDYTYMEPNELYLTDHFFSLKSNEIEVDIMINFKVLNNNHLYIYPFNIKEQIVVDNTLVFLASLDEWYRAYLAMGRVDKAKLIRERR
jgi:hypothetical protein